MHEHIFALSTEHVQNYGDGLWWDEEVRVADAVSKLRALRHKGIKTIVDPTVWGLGRYIPRIQRIAEQVDLNIVVAAGLYVYEELPQQYAYRGPGLLFDVPEPMVTDFARDIVEVMYAAYVSAEEGRRISLPVASERGDDLSPRPSPWQGRYPFAASMCLRKLVAPFPTQACQLVMKNRAPISR